MVAIENRVTLPVNDFVWERIIVGTQSSTDRADDRQKRNVEQQQVHHHGFPQQSKYEYRPRMSSDDRRKGVSRRNLWGRAIFRAGIVELVAFFGFEIRGDPIRHRQSDRLRGGKSDKQAKQKHSLVRLTCRLP